MRFDFQYTQTERKSERKISTSILCIFFFFQNHITPLKIKFKKTEKTMQIFIKQKVAIILETWTQSSTGLNRYSSNHDDILAHWNLQEHCWYSKQAYSNMRLMSAVYCHVLFSILFFSYQQGSRETLQLLKCFWPMTFVAKANKQLLSGSDWGHVFYIAC